MSVAHAIIIGIVQGLTEFLPVSSSGHMTVAEMILGMKDVSAMLALDVAMHAATLLAIAVFFGRVWARTLFARPRLIVPIVIACVPAVLVYFTLHDLVEGAKGALWAVGVAFGLTSAVVILADVRSRGRDDGAADLTGAGELSRGRLGTALAVGFAQAIALFPGVSRSGSTISAALFCRASRESAMSFSFLVGAPLMFGAMLVKGRDVSALLASDTAAVVAGGTAAFASGLLALFALRRVIMAGRLWLFGAYTAILAVGCIIVSIVRALAANGGAA